MTVVRLLSYNIRSLRDDRTALTRVIRRLRPDVVCVQEAPRFAAWRSRRRRLAGGCGLVPVVLRRPAGLEVFAGPRMSVVGAEHHLLSPVPGMHRRGLAVGLFDVGGARFAAATMHLDLAAWARRRHAEEIIERLERVRRDSGVPVVVAGDLNEQPGGVAWDLFAGRFRDGYAVAPLGLAHTHDSVDPRCRIDAVFAAPEIEVIGCGVPDEPGLLTDYPAASDHRPVLAELRIG